MLGLDMYGTRTVTALKPYKDSCTSKIRKNDGKNSTIISSRNDG